jgi:hypothetical protein
MSADGFATDFALVYGLKVPFYVVLSPSLP